MGKPASAPSDFTLLLSRKRSHSTADTITQTTTIDTKRMRLGIQELSTDSLPTTPRTRSDSNSSAESNENDHAESSSLTLDSDESSSSSDDESSGVGIEEGYDSDSESESTTTSSSSSSSDDVSDSQDEGEMRSVYNGPSASLTDRLHAFLPRMAAANAELNDACAAGHLHARNMETVQEGSMHIEMHLGLGVLEEKRDVGLDGSDNDGDESEGASAGSTTSTEMRKNDVMSILMGKKARRKPGIQIVEAEREG